MTGVDATCGHEDHQEEDAKVFANIGQNKAIVSMGRLPDGRPPVVDAVSGAGVVVCYPEDEWAPVAYSQELGGGVRGRFSASGVLLDYEFPMREWGSVRDRMMRPMELEDWEGSV